MAGLFTELADALFQLYIIIIIDKDCQFESGMITMTHLCDLNTHHSLVYSQKELKRSCLL